MGHGYAPGHALPVADVAPDPVPPLTGGRKPPVVIVGLPRSGTTWTMRVLGTSPGTVKVLEPDHEEKFAAAIHAKRRLGRYPCLVPGQQAAAYRELWEWVLAGGQDSWRSVQARRLLGPRYESRIFAEKMDLTTEVAALLARNPRPSKQYLGRVVAKSIHAHMSLEWLAQEFDITPLVLLRHPASVLASWMEVNLKESRYSTLESRQDIRTRYLDRWGVGQPGPDRVETLSWRIALLIAVLEEIVADHPTWQVRTHEQLCTDSVATFHTLFDDLGLEWSGATEEYLVANNVAGVGFETKRVASEVVDSWQKRLDDEQLATLRRVLAQFPITTWSDADFERTAPTD